MGNTLETEEVQEPVRPTTKVAVPARVPGSCICSPADVESLPTVCTYDFTGARFLVTGEQWACEQIIPMFGYKLARKYETVYPGDVYLLASKGENFGMLKLALCAEVDCTNNGKRPGEIRISTKMTMCDTILFLDHSNQSSCQQVFEALRPRDFTPAAPRYLTVVCLNKNSEPEESDWNSETNLEASLREAIDPNVVILKPFHYWSLVPKPPTVIGVSETDPAISYLSLPEVSPRAAQILKEEIALRYAKKCSGGLHLMGLDYRNGLELLLLWKLVQEQRAVPKENPKNHVNFLEVLPAELVVHVWSFMYVYVS